MSTTAFLNTLKKYDLQQYYPSFLNKGVPSLDYLTQLSMQDYSKLGVRSIDDKRKFMDLADEIKAQQQKQKLLQQQHRQEQEEQRLKREHQPKLQARKQKSPTSSIDQARKRAANKLPSPDRKSRRLTLGPPATQQIVYQQRQAQTTPIPRTAPSRPDTSPVIHRRLSYAPPRHIQQQQLSPVRNNLSTKHSPSRPTVASKPSTKNPVQYNDDPFEKKKLTPIQRQPDRHLDAYGIPKHNPRRRLSMDNGNSGHNSSNPYSGMSLDEYMESRNQTSIPLSSSKGLATSSTTTLSSPSFSSNLYQTLSSELQQRIRVCVRKRPLSKKELANGECDISQLVGPHTIQLNAPKTRVDLTPYTEQHSFTFDEAFDSDTSNAEIYQRTARPLVGYVFGGGKATCFAFGQTGSGKTYTMLDPQHGLYIMAARDIFDMLEDPQYHHLSAFVGFYEIYQGKLYDLLNQRKQLIPRDDGNSNVVIAGLREHPISDLNRLLQIFDFGSRSRTTGKTGANDNSSRSHAVLQVLLRDDNKDSVHGKLSFIDLAGSERGVDRGDANTKTRLEGAEINKSLLALKECIRALDQDKKHTPFRGSKLTQVLRDSFVGDSRTCMIATISPNHSNSEHTLNTLRYADRVKELKGESDPRLQADPSPLPTARDRDEAADEKYYQQSSNSQREDTQSITTNDALWDEDVTENLMDVDFPADAIGSNAMGTPRSQRGWAPSTPHRQQGYLRRLSSPPEELFKQDMDDPFTVDNTTSSPSTANSPYQQLNDPHKPTSQLPLPSSSSAKVLESLSSLSSSAMMHSDPPPTLTHEEFYDAPDGLTPTSKGMQSTSSSSSSPSLVTTSPAVNIGNSTVIMNENEQHVSVDHIRDFVRLHRAQIKELEDCIKQQKRMIAKLTLTVSSCHDFNEEGPSSASQTVADNEKVTQEYENYLNDLEDLLERKLACIDTLKDRVKHELGDEELEHN